MHLCQECHRNEAVFLLCLMSGGQCLHWCPPHLDQVPYPTQGIPPPAIKPSSCCSGFNTLLWPATAPIFPSVHKWLHYLGSAYWLLDWTIRNRKKERQREGIGETRKIMRKRMKEEEEQSNTNFEVYYTSWFSVIRANWSSLKFKSRRWERVLAPFYWWPEAKKD